MGAATSSSALNQVTSSMRSVIYPWDIISWSSMKTPKIFFPLSFLKENLDMDVCSDLFNIHTDPQLRGCKGIYKNVDDILTAAPTPGQLEQKME